MVTQNKPIQWTKDQNYLSCTTMAHSEVQANSKTLMEEKRMILTIEWKLPCFSSFTNFNKTLLKAPMLT